MKNNELFNSKQRQTRIRRAKKLLRRRNRGESVADIAADLKITEARVYKLIASVK